jgi:predicted transposase/invertase (TIGR01784 family)
MENKVVQNLGEYGNISIKEEPETRDELLAHEDMIDISCIDYYRLMDLRVDYAFKLFFGTGEPKRLINLLNAIFENKQIPRVVTDLVIVNPTLERSSEKDKLSTLDIRATLSDGTNISIEMQLYDLYNFKYKTLRSWARIYSEELSSGQKYSEQNPVIHISFINDSITDASGKPIDKIHSLFQAIERDSGELLLADMEIHYVNMNAFVRYFEEIGKPKAENDKFFNWMVLITQKEIVDKNHLFEIYKEDREMQEAVATLAKMSEDVYERQAYQRRLDNIRYYEIEKQKNEALLAEKDAIIAKLREQLKDNEMLS